MPNPVSGAMTVAKHVHHDDSPYARATLQLKKKDALAEIAKKRMAEGGRGGVKNADEGPPNLGEVPKSSDTDRQLAKAAGISHGNLNKVERIANKQAKLCKPPQLNNRACAFVYAIDGGEISG